MLAQRYAHIRQLEVRVSSLRAAEERLWALEQLLGRKRSELPASDTDTLKAHLLEDQWEDYHEYNPQSERQSSNPAEVWKLEQQWEEAISRYRASSNLLCDVQAELDILL